MAGDRDETHLDEGTAHAWLDDALPAAEAARVAAHVAACGACAALVAEARGLIAGSTRILLMLDDVPGGVVPKARAADDGLGTARPHDAVGGASPRARDRAPGDAPAAARDAARRPAPRRAWFRDARVGVAAAGLLAAAGLSTLRARDRAPAADAVTTVATAPAASGASSEAARSMASVPAPAPSMAPPSASSVSTSAATRVPGASSAPVRGSAGAPTPHAAPSTLIAAPAPMTEPAPMAPPAPREAPAAAVAGVSARSRANVMEAVAPRPAADAALAPREARADEAVALPRASARAAAAPVPAAPSTGAIAGDARGMVAERAPVPGTVLSSSRLAVRGIAGDSAATRCYAIDAGPRAPPLPATVAIGRDSADAGGAARGAVTARGDSLLVSLGATTLRLARDGDALRGVALSAAARGDVRLRRAACPPR